jgi:ubiquinone/menaquinone biosynthesis C-methylase UbiE
MTWFAKLYLWATHRLYAEFAWAYDPVSWLVSLGHWSAWRRTALDYLQPEGSPVGVEGSPAGLRVLEVAFGTGELLLEMQRQGVHAVGLERSRAMHRITARKLAQRGRQVPRVRSLSQAMPFVDGSFDSLVCTFPAGYILDPATLHEVARLLRPPDHATGSRGGRLVVVGIVITIDNRLWRWAMQFLFGGQEEAVLERFGRLTAAAGLQMQVIEPVGRGWRVPVVLAERA